MIPSVHLALFKKLVACAWCRSAARWWSFSVKYESLSIWQIKKARRLTTGLLLIEDVSICSKGYIRVIESFFIVIVVLHTIFVPHSILLDWSTFQLGCSMCLFWFEIITDLLLITSCPSSQFADFIFSFLRLLETESHLIFF